MAITISGQNNNDKILASDGVLDSISGFNVVGVMTAAQFDVTGKTTIGHLNIGSNIQIGNAGIITATTLIGNVTGNINHTSNLLLQIGGSEKFRVGSSGQLGIAGANYGTSGQVLTSGGSGSAATWSTISGTTINNNADNRIITGSGSANTLEGEANLTWDGTTLLANKASGVGYIVSKGGTSGGDYGIVQVQSGSTVRGRLVSDAAVDAFRLDSAGRASAPITFHTGSSYTERLRITSSGYVGINQSSPQTGLHINQDWINSYGSISVEGSANALVGLGLRSNGNYRGSLIWRDGSSGNYLDIATYGGAYPILFRPNGTERLRIDSSGRVQIGGVTGPNNSKLFVAGTNSTNYITMRNTSGGDGNGDRWNNIRFQGTQSGGEVSTLAILQANHDGTADDEKGAFQVLLNDGNDGDNLQERLRITSTGRITQSNNNEDINMDSSANGQLTLDGNGYAAGFALNATGLNIYHNSSSRAIIFGTNETERLRIGSAGQIGLGGANYGSSGQVLTSQGSGSAVQWATPSTSTDPTTGVANNNVWQTVGSNISWHTNYNNTVNTIGSVSNCNQSNVYAIDVKVRLVFNSSGGTYNYNATHGYLVGFVYQDGKNHLDKGVYTEAQHFDMYYNVFGTVYTIPWDPSGTQNLNIYCTYAYNTSIQNYYNFHVINKWTR